MHENFANAQILPKEDLSLEIELKKKRTLAQMGNRSVKEQTGSFHNQE